jgi:MFS family permease
MNKLWLGVLLGALLGCIDGLSALLSAGHDPVVRDGIVGIVIGSTFKGLIAGALMGWYARRRNNLLVGALLGLSVGAFLAWLVCLAQKAGGQPPYYLEIMLPGSLVGLIVGYATQRYGVGGPAPRAA